MHVSFQQERFCRSALFLLPQGSFRYKHTLLSSELATAYSATSTIYLIPEVRSRIPYMSTTDASTSAQSSSSESNSDSEHPIDAAMRLRLESSDRRGRLAGGAPPRSGSSPESGEVDADPARVGGVQTKSHCLNSPQGAPAVMQQPAASLPLDDVLERCNEDTSSSSGTSAEHLEPAAAPSGVLLVENTEGRNAEVQRLLRAPRSGVAALQRRARADPSKSVHQVP
jgi:hypothetical protein